MNQIKNIENDEMIPLKFHLSQNFPNPFKEKTIIKYCMAYKTNVKITVFNSQGAIIEKLIDEEKNAGTYELEFLTNGLTSRRYNHDYHSNENLKPDLPEGMYFYQLTAGDYTCYKKMEILHKTNEY